MNARATAIVDLNLLPSEERPADVSGRIVALILAFALAIAGIAPLAVYTQRVESRSSDMERRAAEAQRHLDTLQVEFTRSRALRVEIDEAVGTANALQSERRALQQGARPLHEELSMVYDARFLPAGTRITQITGVLSTLLVEGVAPDPLAAIAYAAALATDGGFPSARLVSFEPATGGGAFNVEVER